MALWDRANVYAEETQTLQNEPYSAHGSRGAHGYCALTMLMFDATRGLHGQFV